MWLCTQHGFFSIVRKGDDQYHVRARVRKDLENLLVQIVAIDGHRASIPIEEWEHADYRFRIIIDLGELRDLMLVLAHDLDYDNFKGRIATLPDQRGKMGDYHNLWHAGVCWQQDDERERRRSANGGYDEDDIRKLIYTSVDDLKSGLFHHKAAQVPLLRASLQRCLDEGLKTKASHLARRIKQLTK